jgi:hypothetical protein
MTTPNPNKPPTQIDLPTAEVVQQELAKAKGIDDFFGKEGIFARLFARTLEQMLDAELTAELGYERYKREGWNSGNSRNGKTEKKIRTSAGDTTIRVPRDRNGEFEPVILKKHQTGSNETLGKDYLPLWQRSFHAPDPGHADRPLRHGGFAYHD